MTNIRRTNNKKNKRKKNNKKKNNPQANTNTANSSVINNNNNNNEIKTVTSISEYRNTLVHALDEIDVIYTSTILNQENFNFNEKYKEAIINVFKKKSDNPDHLVYAKFFSNLFNDENGYWDINGRTNSYSNNFNRIFYNENQFQRKKMIYPISFKSLFHLYNEYNV
ncbi:hypothetical protein LY90DRAFT_507143 [Neocallimastix californiae]|jgi:hypothetical protein|uniref:Uncharacterized protein n=1 Tax=Neocallimastix californiae TaxID=1754190 RepID=A0A1Y2D9N5_9FUNG|nr:hypothetical protein LY90DRAFT_507143 [Neocallimastix californiae]|eukprot:ORY55395.1 hypothetical protein LY90DRAFT_507143 [Neocallimastix californiae]